MSVLDSPVGCSLHAGSGAPEIDSCDAQIIECAMFSLVGLFTKHSLFCFLSIGIPVIFWVKEALKPSSAVLSAV